MTELPIQRLLLEAIRVVDRANVPYMILGGFAVRTWGIPRPTYDADLAVAADDAGLQRLLSALEDAWFDVPEEHRGGFQDTSSGMKKVKVTRFEGGTVWELDLFLAGGELLETAMHRRCATRLEGADVWVASPEDIILLKLIAFRRKDQLDVEEILKISRDLEIDYLRRWAGRLGISDRLAEFLDA